MVVGLVDHVVGGIEGEEAEAGGVAAAHVVLGLEVVGIGAPGFPVVGIGDGAPGIHS